MAKGGGNRAAAKGNYFKPAFSAAPVHGVVRLALVRLETPFQSRDHLNDTIYYLIFLLVGSLKIALWG